jgi:hypothetical protein
MVNGEEHSTMRFAIYHLPFAISLLLLTACGGTPSPSIEVDRSQRPSVVEVRGLPRRDIRALRNATLTTEQWQQILRVSLRGAPLPIAGRYSAESGVLRFTPMYDFDNWRSFDVTFDPIKIPGADPREPWRSRQVSKLVAFEGMGVGRATYVKHVYPSGPELPENTLRFYIEFSAPMGRASALDHIRLIGEDGTHVIDPFLPVEADLWTPDRTRFTLFFDPGRVKRGIKPNRDLGRALVAGQRYALVVGERWPDGRAQPLKSGYRHEITAVRAVEKPLDQRDWKLSHPEVLTREPLVVTFPWALDYGLMHRALGVRRGGVEVPGEIAIDGGEKRWSFTPRDPWATDNYTLVALTLLEDPAGNRLGRAFEVMRPPTDSQPSVEVFFTIK